MDDRDLRWKAVEIAYRDHADDVYRVALAILRDPDAAVDSTHDSFRPGALGRQLGRWMAPPAAAKVFLLPALAISDDGERIYALGIDRTGGEEAGGSRGIFVFDASTLEAIGHWTPTADFISLAISPDGRFVYAAGDAGRDAAGRGSPNAASITVYDPADGSVG